jgi:hypothetical protein
MWTFYVIRLKIIILNAINIYNSTLKINVIIQAEKPLLIKK